MADDVRQQKVTTGRVVEANAVKNLKDKINSLSPEDRRQRYADMRARLGRSKIKVNSPEGIVACWALKTNEYEMARLEWLGWKIVQETKTDVVGKPPVWHKRFDAAGFRQDGTYILGDVILMEIDEETYLLQKQIELDDFEDLQAGISRGFKEKAATLGESGVPTFEIKDDGKRTVPVVQGA